MPAPARHGIILIDKPPGPTSFACVNRVRSTLLTAYPELAPPRRRGPGGRGPRFKCGHAGTLDPLATGLLLVLVGRGTRLSPFLTGLDKAYRCTARFGVGTDTDDAAGRPVETRPVVFAEADLTAALDGFRGEILQRPPAFSAIKRDGRRLYELARSGEPMPEVEARPLRVDRLEATVCTWGGKPGPGDGIVASDGLVYEAELYMECSSGTYVRSLVRDLAGALGTVGHVRTLRREGVGAFDVAGALDAASLEDGAALMAGLRPLAAAVAHLPTFVVGAEDAGRLRNGGQPEAGWLRGAVGGGSIAAPIEGDCFGIRDTAGELVAVARIDADGLPRTGAVFQVPEEA